MKYTECDHCFKIVEAKYFFKLDSGWCFSCPECSAVVKVDDITDFLLPIGTKIQLCDGRYGVISAYVHSQASRFEDIRYKIILEEKSVTTLPRSYFEVVRDWRLTQRIPKRVVRVCHYPTNQEYSNVPCYGCVDRTKCSADILERLAQYEDTGLTPDEIKTLKNR